MRTRSVLATLGLAVCSVACTDAGFGSPLATEQEPIVKGMLSTDADNAVVGILSRQNACSGTLIAPNVVLTAMHCVTDYNPAARFTCNADGSLQTDTPGNGQLGALLDPATLTFKVGVSPEVAAKGKTIFGSGATTVCKNDLALVVLDQDIDIGTAPLATLRFGRVTPKGEPARVLGYGRTEMEAGATGRQERDDVQVLAVGELSPSMPGESGIVPHTVVTGEGACQGDSGGPLFSQETGAQIGVYSLLLSQTCIGPDVRNSYTQVAAFESLIRDALNAAGHEPLVEPEPSGSGGDAGASAQGGEGNAASEGGAPSGVGGSANSAGGAGGSSVAAGSGGTGANSTAGQGLGADDEGQGSGSRRDPSCACRASATAGNAPLGLFALGGLLLRLRRRRQAL